MNQFPPKPLRLPLGPFRIYRRSVDAGSKFATGVVDTSGKFAAGIVDNGVVPWLANISASLEKFWKDPNVISKGLGEDDSWKNLKQKL